MIIGKNGVCKTRTIRRVPEEERWDRAAIEEVKFTPWMIKERSATEEHDGPQEVEHKTSVDIEINREIELEVKLPPRSVDPNPRRVYITKSRSFGGTEGCLGCTTAMLGGKGVAHSEECRERMEEHIRRDPTEREMVCSDQENTRICEQVLALEEGRGAQGGSHERRRGRGGGAGQEACNS